MQLSVRTQNSVKILALSGRFDTTAAQTVHKWIDEAASIPPARVVVNMSEVEFVDSTGLSTLVQGMKRSQQNNGNLHLCGLQQPVRLIFELTRLDRFFEIYPIEEDAINAFVN